MSVDKQTEIYDRIYQSTRYSKRMRNPTEKTAWHQKIEAFVEKYGLQDRKCLEIGCGVGLYQDIVEDYVGTDIAEVVREHLHKPFVRASATQLPFEDASFDGAWSIHVLEHVPDVELALGEIRRVMKDGAIVLLAPAWFCRSWAANGYTVRPYSDFDWRGKLTKASIPLRNSVLLRLPITMVARAIQTLKYALRRQPTKFSYGSLTPDYENNWVPDADAINAMDPFDVVLWFTSRGDECVTCPTLAQAFRFRTGGLVFRIRKSGSSSA